MTTALEPMTAAEAADYGPQWGSYMNSYDPGYIMYTAIPPEEAAHRDEMVAWLRDHCLPTAREGVEKGWPEHADDEPEQVARMIAYLEALSYPTEPLPVIFRAERYGRFKGDVTAVFPTIEGAAGEMTCYAHIGQHASCTLDWYRQTRPALPAEYADLLRELRGIYEQGDDPVRLVVRKRRP